MSNSENILSFIVSAAHDTKTPLNAVISSTELLSDSDLNQEQLIDLLEIKRGSLELRRYLETIFSYAKFCSDSFPLHPYPFRIGRSLVGIIDEYNLEDNTGASSVSLFARNETVDRVQGDLIRFELVVGNLLMYYMQQHPRGSRIGLSFEQLESSQDAVKLQASYGILSSTDALKELPEFTFDPTEHPRSLSEAVRFMALQSLSDLNGEYSGRQNFKGGYVDRFILELSLPRKESATSVNEVLAEQLGQRAKYQQISESWHAYHFDVCPEENVAEKIITEESIKDFLGC